MKLKDFVCNRDFDVNAEYDIYRGIWNDEGELLWRSVGYNNIVWKDEIIWK